MPYVPIGDFREKDFDRSSRPIRDFPTGKSQYALSVFPREMRFGETKTGAVSDSQTAVLINTGYEDLVINAVRVAGDFGVEQPVPTILRRGEQTSIKVFYEPKGTGDNTGSVYIDTGDSVNQEYISLIGSAVNPGFNLESTLIRATNSETGTPNYIQATTEQPVPAANGRVLVSVNITEANTSGDVQIAFNKDAPLNVRNGDGTALPAGFLLSGSTIVGYRYNDEFRILVGNQSAAILTLITNEADRSKSEADRSRREADRAAGYVSDAVSQGNVPIYSSARGIRNINIPDGINFIRTNGYYSSNGLGSANYRLKSLIELDEPADIISNNGNKRWSLVEEYPDVYQLGCVADYDPTTGRGTDNAPFINAAFRKWRTIRGMPGLFMINNTVDTGLYGSIIAPVPSGGGLGTNAQALDYFNANTMFILIPRNIPRVHVVEAMITECEHGGGVIDNPNAAKAYTESSNGRMSKFRLIDFTNKDASGVTPATKRRFSAAVKVGREGVMMGVVIRTTRNDGALIPSASILDFGNAPDVGFYCENPYFAALLDCHASWAFRMYAALCLNHNNGDGFVPEGDGFKAQRCSFEGYRSFGVRGMDRHRITAVSGNTVSIRWFRSHQFENAGTIRIGSTAVTYTGLVYSVENSGVLTFTGLNNVPVNSLGAFLSRNQDYNDSGVGEMEFSGFLRGMTHASLHFPTDSAFSDPFDSPSSCIEISGSKVRGVHFRGIIGHPRDELFALINDAGTVTFDGYAEAKDITGVSGACGIAALGQQAMEMGYGGVPNPGPGARNIQFSDSWDQTLTIDTSPAYRPQNSVGRFGGDWNLFMPDGSSNPFYSKRSRDGTSNRTKAPRTLGQKHPIQFTDADANIRATMDRLGNWAFGRTIDTEADLLGILNILNNGGHRVEVINTASNTQSGYRATTTGGNASYLVDSSGRAAIQSGNVTRMTIGASFWQIQLAVLPNYADDAAASAAGVQIGQLYRTGSNIKVRAA